MLDPRAIPPAIHSHVMERATFAGRAGHALGGLKYSKAMQRYLSETKPLAQKERESAWREWWRDEYVVSRLKAADARGELPPRALDIVLGLHRARMAADVDDRASAWAATARHYRITHGTLVRLNRTMEQYVRTHYLPYARPHRPSPPNPPPQ